VPTAAAAVQPVRYAADRTFAAQGGYLTDTKLSGGATGADVELTFASDRYFAFAAAESGYGAGPLLAAGNNVRFELLGRTFRVTDPGALPRSVDTLPTEWDAIPDPRWRPTPSVSGTSTMMTTVTGAASPTPAPVADRPPTALVGRSGCACDAGPGGGVPAPAGGLLLLALLVGRRRHRAHRAQRVRPLPRLPLVALALLPLALSACDAQPLDSRAAAAPDGGGTAVVSSLPPICMATMASFTDGLRADLAANVGAAWRTSSYEVAVDGVTVTPGYGQDLALLSTGFSVGPVEIGQLAPDASAMTLSFGGWRSQSAMRNGVGFHAADQLWTALAGAPETMSGSAVIRTTSGRRAACRRYDASGTLTIDCVLGGLIRADAAEAACPPPPSP